LNSSELFHVKNLGLPFDSSCLGDVKCIVAGEVVADERAKRDERAFERRRDRDLVHSRVKIGSNVEEGVPASSECPSFAIAAVADLSGFHLECARVSIRELDLGRANLRVETHCCTNDSNPASLCGKITLISEDEERACAVHEERIA
jgi:hypothetical protein